MSSTVKIVKNSKNGQVFTPGTKQAKDKKFYGFYIVEASTIVEEGGFIKRMKRTAILAVENELGKELNYQAGTEKAGKIIWVETTTPTPGFQAVVNPSKNNEPVLRGGKPLYRKSVFTADLSRHDELVKRDASEAIGEEISSSASMAN